MTSSRLHDWLAFANLHLNWRPADFWAATPREFWSCADLWSAQEKARADAHKKAFAGRRR